VIKLTFTT